MYQNGPVDLVLTCTSIPEDKSQLHLYKFAVVERKGLGHDEKYPVKLAPDCHKLFEGITRQLAGEKSLREQLQAEVSKLEQAGTGNEYQELRRDIRSIIGAIIGRVEPARVDADDMSMIAKMAVHTANEIQSTLKQGGEEGYLNVPIR